MARIRASASRISLYCAIGERLATVATQFFGPRGISQMAASIGVTSRTYNRWIKGATPDGESILRLIHIYRIEAHWLLTGSGPMQRDPSLEADMARDVIKAARKLIHRAETIVKEDNRKATHQTAATSRNAVARRLDGRRAAEVY